MKEKEKLERVFQEELKNLEVGPPLDSWDFIKEHLEKEEDKERVLPIFWWKTAALVSGIAAIFVIGIFLFKNKKDTKFLPETTIAAQEQNSPIAPSSINEKTFDNQSLRNENINSKNEIGKNPKSHNNKIASEESQTKKNIKTQNRNDNSNISYAKNNCEINNLENVQKGKKNIISNNPENKTILKQQDNSNILYAENDSDNILNLSGNKNKHQRDLASIKSNKNRKTKKSNDDSGILLAKENTKLKSTDNSTKSIGKKHRANKNLASNKSSKQKNKNSEKSNEEPDVLLADANSEQKNQDKSSNPTMPEINSKNNNIKDEILNNDSLLLAKNIEERNLLKKQDSLIKKGNQAGKFSLSGTVAPIFASGTQGSAIDPTFNDNNKAFDNNTSYGIKIAYNINDRLSINTGIQYLDLQYNTEGISFYKQSSITSIPVKPIQTISYNSNLYSIENGHTQNMSSSPGQQISSGSLLQKVSYYEIPFELNYSFLNSKLKISSVIGVSGYFLNTNKMFLVSKDESVEIGKYNNFNNFHYSGNIGLGFEYPIINKINIRIEPIFKYNFNAFKDKDNSFDPYFLGVYTGINYSF